MRYEAANLKKWIVPMAALLSAALLGFAVFYALDQVTAPTPSAGGSVGGWERFFLFDADHITDAVPALGGMIAAVLGIVITVVSIVVQLSASRYHGVATMFFRDRTNLAVMGFYIIACVAGVLVSLSVRADFVPRATLVAMMIATAVGLVLMAPYFAYVFWFLEPTNIIARIHRDALQVVTDGSCSDSRSDCENAQVQVVSAMEELTDLSSNSISGKDKIIASRAVDALKDFAVDYVQIKKNATDQWFELGAGIVHNPDFVAMEPESREDLVDRQTWVEWKVMRQYLGIYNEALSTMPDINYLIAIDTRYIGEAAGEADDDELIILVFRFMNSYLRATLNAKSVRTAYNVLNQYRQLVEAMLRTGHGDVAVEAVGFMKYYGHISFDMKIPFVTETVAYDVGALCEVAHRLGLKEEEPMLHSFLELDRPTAMRSQEQALKGVRKAQVKLAAYYLNAGDRDKARLIFRDMEHEPPDRLEAIRSELERVETKDFWEIIDRGRNFEYMPPDQKNAMRRFFGWFEGADSSADSAPESGE
ncbi:MAG: DUF2254 domain-containing protein [Deltaproteobacteria bacterium]|jgi:hypothetical protein|nr:DUF2254 domain-containing protein [Deltaproteobacteria bacterium]MBW2537073.1 DUF2254 domain-containing protein [Deltaproteobacteria bacterium]